jgi:hypothetical protein
MRTERVAGLRSKFDRACKYNIGALHVDITIFT